MIVDGGFHDQRIDQADRHTVSHDQKHQNDLPFIIEQIAEQPQQCLYLTALYALLIIFI